MAKDFENDENMQKRKRAARRSNNFKAGKPVDAEEVVADTEETPAPEEVPGEAPTEGGIVADAEQELAEAKAEAAEEETPAKEMAETPAEEMAETPAEETPTETSEEEVPAEETEAEMPAEEAPSEEMPEDAGEYMAPEGTSHDELINAYHEAIAYGDVEKANEMYKQLQDHRYNENKYRAKTEAAAEADAREHLAAAKELAVKYPELGEDGVAADKVMALMEVYHNNGMKPAAALRQAVADLYPEAPAEMPMAEAPAEMPAPEVPAEEASAPEMPPREAEGMMDGEAEVLSEDELESRRMKKRAMADVPTAAARNEPAPEPEKPTRTGAIAQMRKARGQG